MRRVEADAPDVHVGSAVGIHKARLLNAESEWTYCPLNALGEPGRPYCETRGLSRSLDTVQASFMMNRVSDRPQTRPGFGPWFQ